MNPAAYYVGPEMQALQTASSAVSRMANQEVSLNYVLLPGTLADLHEQDGCTSIVCSALGFARVVASAAASISNGWPMSPLF